MNTQQRPNSNNAKRTLDGGYDPRSDGLTTVLHALLLAAVIMAPIVALGGTVVYGTWREQTEARIAAEQLARAHADLVAAPALGVLAVADASHGREVFVGTCAACHGPDAKGIKGLGKDLTISNFVASKSDDELCQFIIEGRPTAKPMPMPPKAGRDDLTDSDLRHVVSYLRGLQDPRRMPTLPAIVVSKEPTEAQKNAALAAAGGDAELAGYIASGNKLFHSSCVACHGAGGVGIKGNGKALAKNDFVRSLDDDSLLAFIKRGRDPSDPKNTTGIQMPPKGGNPAMSDDDILDIIAYLRTLQGASQSAAKVQ